MFITAAAGARHATKSPFSIFCIFGVPDCIFSSISFDEGIESSRRTFHDILLEESELRVWAAWTHPNNTF
jgi:hypothetical protein